MAIARRQVVAENLSLRLCQAGLAATVGPSGGGDIPVVAVSSSSRMYALRRGRMPTHARPLGPHRLPINGCWRLGSRAPPVMKESSTFSSEPAPLYGRGVRGSGRSSLSTSSPVHRQGTRRHARLLTRVGPSSKLAIATPAATRLPAA